MVSQFLVLIYRTFHGNLQMAVAEGVRRQLEDTGPDREFWIKLCKSFLKTEEE